MSVDKKSYQRVMKATTLFGGVQVIHIVISIMRSKVIALFIGAEGMGIAALLLAPLRLITAATTLGLDQSAVREIAGAGGHSEEKATLKIISVLKTLTYLTALVGAIVLIGFSPLLSRWSFQSDQYVFSFVWLGLALLFNQLAASRLAILQGLRKLRFLAKSNLYGAICGLIVTVPLYYFLGIDGILPAIISTSAFVFLFAQYFYKKLKLKIEPLSVRKALSEGKPMLKLGIILSLSAFVGLLVAYLLRIFIGYQSGEAVVGYYSAGIIILNTYVGLIFKAMSSDYFPRLSIVSNDKTALSKAVFEQAFIAVLLMTPIIVLFIAFASPLITILYSNEFDPTVGFVRWGILGMLFKAVSWSVGYVIIAKGDSKLFMKTTFFFNSILLLFNIIGYYYFGLEGVGISLLFYFVFHFFAVQLITRIRYNFKMSSGFYPMFIICLLLCILAFSSTFIENTLLKYGVLIFILGVSIIYSFTSLDQKIGFKVLMLSIFKKKKND